MGEAAKGGVAIDSAPSDIEGRVCGLIAQLGQAHYSEIRSSLGLGPDTWRRVRAQLLAEGRIAEVFPGMYEVAAGLSIHS
jgi:hypothetical protein